MRVNHEYHRGGALAYLAAYDVHRAHVVEEKGSGAGPAVSGPCRRLRCF